MTTTVIVNVGNIDPGVIALIERITKAPDLQLGEVITGATLERFPTPFPAPQPGERYAGIVLKEDGTPSHHLFALPVPDKRMKQAEALAWMDSVGSRPTCSEGALVYANLRQHFNKEWHWLGDVESAGSAWCQGFDDGYQDTYVKDYEFLPLAVRRSFL